MKNDQALSMSIKNKFCEALHWSWRVLSYSIRLIFVKKINIDGILKRYNSNM